MPGSRKGHAREARWNPCPPSLEQRMRERLQGTILHEHWRVEFRRRYFTQRSQLQRSLDSFALLQPRAGARDRETSPTIARLGLILGAFGGPRGRVRSTRRARRAPGRGPAAKGPSVIIPAWTAVR